MQSLSEIYGDRFMSKRAKYAWRAPIVCAIVNYLFSHKQKEPMRSVIDVGAATGDLVDGYLRLGLDAWGLEGDESCLRHLLCPEGRMVIHDLRLPLVPQIYGWSRFDVATCWEVLEHVEEEHVETLVDNLCALSDRLLISACPPNPHRMGRSGSVHHVNEQPPEYWAGKFKARGYARWTKQERRFRDCANPWRWHYGIRAFWENVLAFAKP